MSVSRDAIQAEAVDAICRERAAGRKSTLMQMPTQTGKTRTACKYIKRGIGEWNGRFLVVAHMGELLDQWARELDSLGIAYAVEKSVQRARDTMNSCDAIRVCLGSKDTLQDRGKSSRLSSWPKDLFTDVLEDECHLATAKTWENVHKHFDRAFRVGMTATIDRLDGVPLSTVFDSTAYAYSIRDAIANGHRVPFKVVEVQSNVDIRGLKADASGQFAPGEMEAVLGPRMEDLANIVRRRLDECRDRYGTEKAIAFLPSVRLAYAFAEFLTKIGVHARAVDGYNADRRAVILDHQRGAFPVLCNQKLLGMGYNDPAVGAVIDLSPTTSRAWFDQKAGRCGATREGKECGVLMYVGWQADPRTKLVGPTDIFAVHASAKVRDRAREKLKASKDADPLKLLDEAEKEVAAEDGRDRNRAGRKMRYDARKREVRHTYREYDPIGVVPHLGAYRGDRVAVADPATPEHVRRLADLGIEAGDVSRATAEALIDFWSGRASVGLLSPKQYRMLARLAPPDRVQYLTKAEASKVIGAHVSGAPLHVVRGMIERYAAVE